MRQCAAYVTAVGVSVLGLGMLFTVSRHEARVLADGKPAASNPGLPPSFTPSKQDRVYGSDEAAAPFPTVPTRVNDDPFATSPIRAVDALKTRDNAPPASPGILENSGVGSTSIPTKPTTRVTLLLSPDQQIQIVAAGKPEVLGSAASVVNAIFITAVEFHLAPPTVPGAGHQIFCRGDVEVHSSRFSAGGRQLSIQQGELILEGTEEIPAHLTKAGTVTTPVSEPIAPRTAPPVEPSVTPNFDDFAPRPVTRTASPPAAPPAAVAPKPVLPEFRITAQRISFTLALDQIKVGDQAVIATPAPRDPAALEPRVPSATPPTPRAPRDSNVPERGTLPMPPQLPEDGVQKPEVPKVS